MHDFFLAYTKTGKVDFVQVRQTVYILRELSFLSDSVVSNTFPPESKWRVSKPRTYFDPWDTSKVSVAASFLHEDI